MLQENCELDLYNNKYDMETLKKYIYAIHLLDILKTQKIDSYFAVKYILNKNYQLTKEEETITIETVLYYQPHISRIDLVEIPPLEKVEPKSKTDIPFFFDNSYF